MSKQHAPRSYTVKLVASELIFRFPRRLSRIAGPPQAQRQAVGAGMRHMRLVAALRRLALARLLNPRLASGSAAHFGLLSDVLMNIVGAAALAAPAVLACPSPSWLSELQPRCPCHDPPAADGWPLTRRMMRQGLEVLLADDDKCTKCGASMLRESMGQFSGYCENHNRWDRVPSCYICADCWDEACEGRVTGTVDAAVAQQLLVLQARARARPPPRRQLVHPNRTVFQLVGGLRPRH